MGYKSMTRPAEPPSLMEKPNSTGEIATEPELLIRERWLLLFLRVVGATALLAFLASVMPESWIVETSEELGFDPFPYSPLTFYLARNLSLLYGFVGATLLIIATDLARYRPLLRYAALGTILFSVCQLIVDSMSGLPAWWTWGESGSTLMGGILLFWLQKTQPSPSESRAEKRG
jgi:hypothetical protein